MLHTATESVKPNARDYRCLPEEVRQRGIDHVSEDRDDTDTGARHLHAGHHFLRHRRERRAAVGGTYPPVVIERAAPPSLPPHELDSSTRRNVPADHP